MATDLCAEHDRLVIFGNMKIVFATHNLNKLKEVQLLLPKEIELLSLSDIDCDEEIDETGRTLEANAILKANYVTDNYGYDCFADDTGLEVGSLNNEPGVYSARYAGINASSEDNMNKLLNALDGKLNRSAQFRTVIALNFKGLQIFEGICKGEILLKASGSLGFGYDPIFKPLGFEKSFSEMTLEQKNKISHRGKGVRALVDFLTSSISE